MKKEIDLIKKGLKRLPKAFWEFLMKVFVFIFLYGRLLIIPCIISFGIMHLLKVIGIPFDICEKVMKSVFTIGQIIPAASYAGAINEDSNIEGSMDICFAGLLISSMWIWSL